MTYTAQTLWKKIDIRGPDECWPWLGFRNEQGYGRVWIADIGYYAHRVIYSIARGGLIEWAAPKDKNAFGFIRHSCDNPSCCNPGHLLIGTHTDNMQDKVQRGRLPNLKGERGPRAKLTDKQAEEIRWIASKGIASSEIARLYGVSKPTIKSIRCGRAY